MKIADLANIVSFEGPLTAPECEITSLVFDSRKASGNLNELFIALPGTQHDGHHFVHQLYQQGIRNFLVAITFNSNDYPDGTFIKVPDTLSALQQIAAHIRSAFEKPVIGITGSNGKTIVKEWLGAILEQHYRVIKSPKSYNSQLGVALSLWPLNDSFDVAVIEAGISKKDEMSKLENMIRPTIGIFTNIGAAHAQGFGAIEEKIKEKATLFKQSDIVIYHHDHQVIGESLRQKGINTLSWSIADSNADIFILSSEKRISFPLNDQSFELTLPFTNPQDLENILHAIICSAYLGISNKDIQKAVNKLKAIPMRLELKKGNNNTYILDDTYNNDLLGLEIALDYLLLQPHKSKKSVILSDILQTGKESKVLYAQVNDLLIKHKIGRLIGIGTEINAQSEVFSMDFTGFASTKDFFINAPNFADEIVLVKGARDFELERVVNYLEERNHDTVLEVNFEALLHNLNMYRTHLSPATKLMVMVKAFAYGVGVEETAHLLQYHRADYLGVAYIDEAINLRKKGITLPIMIMNVEWNSFRLLEMFDLEPEIYSIAMLRKFLDSTDNPPAIHLKIETGMNRLGFSAQDIPELINILQANPQLYIAGIFTHFSSADMSSEDNYTRMQAEVFDTIYAQLTEVLAYNPIKHALNSAGILRWPQYQFDMVRLGIGLYGYDSTDMNLRLKPISKLKSVISQIKAVKAGDSIGYSRVGQATKDSRIATIAIGYADGYSRAFSNGKAYMIINGQKAMTIGNVCMDMTMIDVTGLDVNEGDEVIVFGEAPTIEDLAKWANTIPYEILTNVSQRVKRVFVSE